MDTGHAGTGGERDRSTVRLDLNAEGDDPYVTIPIDDVVGDLPPAEPTEPRGYFVTDPDLDVTPRQRRRSTGVMSISVAALTALVVGMATLVAVADAAGPGDPLYGVDQAAEDFWLWVAPGDEATARLQDAFDEERAEEGVPVVDGEGGASVADDEPESASVPAHPNAAIWIILEEQGGREFIFNWQNRDDMPDRDYLPDGDGPLLEGDGLLDGDRELGENLPDGDGLLGEDPLGYGGIQPGGNLGDNLPGGGEIGGSLPGGGEIGGNLPDIGGDGGLGDNLPDIGGDGGGDLGDNLPDIGGDGGLGENLPDWP